MTIEEFKERLAIPKEASQETLDHSALTLMSLMGGLFAGAAEAVGLDPTEALKALFQGIKQ